MNEVLVLTEADLRRVVRLDTSAVDCVEAAFSALATTAVVMPPIMRLDIAERRGEVDVKTAYVPGLDSFAIKISPGFFDNPKRGLPSLNGMMVLLSAETGLLKALLLDNGYLTNVRTGAAGAVAARHLAPAEASSAAIFGGGLQAELQLEALMLVRPINRAQLWCRDRGKAQLAADLLTRKLKIPVTATVKAEDACSRADVIVTTTPAETPILKADWLHAGQHVTAVGSDSEHKNEIDPALFHRAIYVADSLDQTRRLGELHHAIRAGCVSSDAVFPELGRIVVGFDKGRASNDDITICDLTGTGVQDTAIATLAYARAVAAGEGHIIQTLSKQEEIA
jgi:ornithine cyclodeaminase